MDTHRCSKRLENCFIKPTFPTRRWGKIYTKTATTDILKINQLVTILKDKGLIVRKRKCLETMIKHRNRYIFYKIEVKD